MKYMMLIYMEDQALNEAEREHCYVESTRTRTPAQVERPVPGRLPRCSPPPPPPASGCATASAW